MNQKQNDIEMISDEANKVLKLNDDEISFATDEDRVVQEASKTSNSSSFLAVQVGIGSDFFFQAQSDNSGLGKESNRCSKDEMQHYGIPSCTINSKEQVRFLELDWNDKKNEHVDMVINNKKPWVNSFQSNVTKSFAETIGDKSSTFSASIKHIPKVVGKNIGEVEMPYSSLMLGSVPYHSTLYGFFVGKPIAFNTVRYFAF
ncbi:hypothetical protein L1887_40740 [Cichorium endivia]|nr:hypothetical protein L1887_40740 [Cichorium endivia]